VGHEDDAVSPSFDFESANKSFYRAFRKIFLNIAFSYHMYAKNMQIQDGFCNCLSSTVTIPILNTVVLYFLVNNSKQNGG